MAVCTGKSKLTKDKFPRIVHGELPTKISKRPSSPRMLDEEPRVGVESREECSAILSIKVVIPRNVLIEEKWLPAK
jgi:hypothetical protein